LSRIRPSSARDLEQHVEGRKPRDRDTAVDAGAEPRRRQAGRRGPKSPDLLARTHRGPSVAFGPHGGDERRPRRHSMTAAPLTGSGRESAGRRPASLGAIFFIAGGIVFAVLGAWFAVQFWRSFYLGNEHDPDDLT